MWDCHVLDESVWSGGKKRKGERKRGKKLPAISHGAGYCAVNKISSAHVTITLVVNGSTGWFYIYVYIFRKFERKLPSMSVEIGFEGKRNDSRRLCFMGELEKKKNCSMKRNRTISRKCKIELLFNYFFSYFCFIIWFIIGRKEENYLQFLLFYSSFFSYSFIYELYKSLQSLNKMTRLKVFLFVIITINKIYDQISKYKDIKIICWILLYI